MHYLLHHLTLVEHFRTCRSEMTWKEILRCSLVETKFNFVCKLKFKSKRRFAVMNYSGNDLWRSRTRLCHSMYDVGFTCYSKKVIKGTFGPHLHLLHLKITSAQETNKDILIRGVDISIWWLWLIDYYQDSYCFYWLVWDTNFCD